MKQAKPSAGAPDRISGWEDPEKYWTGFDLYR